MNWTSGGSGRIVLAWSGFDKQEERWQELPRRWERQELLAGNGELTDRVFVAESELQAVGLVEIERILVKDLDVHLPFL